MTTRIHVGNLLCSTAFISSLFLFSSHVLAQDDAVTLDELTIIGTRTDVPVQDNPRSVSVVGQEQLKRQAPLSIGEALRDIPGVELVDAGVPGMKRLRIRGESSRRVTILVDGQEITDHSSYGTPILINPAAVERIDVVRGPASVLWGAKAIGGVVNIITKKGTKGKAAELELGGSYYSGTKGRQGWASLGGTIGNFDYRITGGVAEHNDQRTPKGQFTNSGRLENTEFENDDISAHIGLTFGANKNHYLSFKAEQYRLESESYTDPSEITGSTDIDFGSLVFPSSGITAFDIDLPQRDRKKFGLFYDGKDLSSTIRKVHFDAYYQTIDREFTGFFEEVDVVVNPPATVPFNNDFNISRVGTTSDDQITNIGGTAQIDLQFHSDHLTILGAQYLHDNLETDKTTNIFSGSITPGGIFGGGPPVITSFDEANIQTFSLFGQNEWSITNDLKLTTGLRYYHVETELEETRTNLGVGREAFLGSSSEDKLLTSVGLTYKGIQDTTLRALYSEGYITPTLIQLFGSTSAGGQQVIGSPDLESETSQNYEIGFRYDASGFAVDMALYYSETENYINTISCAASPGNCPSTSGADYTFANIDVAKTHGVELLLQYTLPNTGITPYFSGAYTKRELQFENFSTYNSNVPRFSGRFGVRYEWQFANINAWADLYARASTDVKRTELDLNENAVGTDEVDSWATLNLAFGGTYGPEDKYRFAVQINNITDEEYRPLIDALPGVGRSIEVTAAVKF
jgi:hemoglobin/transferrin/lactoferrin receptor protein